MTGLNATEFVDDSAEPAVRGFLHRPPQPRDALLVLTHGAGSNCAAPVLVALAEKFADAGFTVLRCDLPFRQARAHGPPYRNDATRDRLGIKRAVKVLQEHSRQRMFFGGISYGGRQGCMLAAEEPGLFDALLLLSYPLHPPGKPLQLRTAHFANLQTPAFFVQGERDPFGAPEEVATALKAIPARTKLMLIATAGHDLAPLRRKTNLTGFADVPGEFCSFANIA